jgi:hypothetical protein
LIISSSAIGDKGKVKTVKKIIIMILLAAGSVFSQSDLMRIAVMDSNAIDMKQSLGPSVSELGKKKNERSALFKKGGVEKRGFLFLSFAGISGIVGLFGILDSNTKYGDATEKYTLYKSETDPVVLTELHQDIESLLTQGNSSRTVGMAGVWTAVGCGMAGIVLMIVDASRNGRIKKLDREIRDLEGRVSLSPMPSGWALAWTTGF